MNASTFPEFNTLNFYLNDDFCAPIVTQRKWRNYTLERIYAYSYKLN